MLNTRTPEPVIPSRTPVPVIHDRGIINHIYLTLTLNFELLTIIFGGKRSLRALLSESFAFLRMPWFPRIWRKYFLAGDVPNADDLIATNFGPHSTVFRCVRVRRDCIRIFFLVWVESNNEQRIRYDRFCSGHKWPVSYFKVDVWFKTKVK